MVRQGKDQLFHVYYKHRRSRNKTTVETTMMREAVAAIELCGHKVFTFVSVISESAMSSAG